jgi:multimeric flavodoxin WrbA
MRKNMRVLGLVGSPRKGSNTDLLVTRILEGAQANGSSAEKLYLYDLAISPCIDCRACKKSPFKCPIKDDMLQVYPKLEAADIVVFGTPMYWYAPSATMKLLIDRLRPFISKKLKGKKGIVVIPSEEGADKCAGMVDMFKCSFKYLGMEWAGKVLAQAYEKAEVEKHPQILLSAFELGKTLK